MKERFQDWQYPVIEDGKPTRYNWVVQHKNNLDLGYETDIGAFTYINAKFGVRIEDQVQIGSHCSIFSVSTIDDKHGQVVLKHNCKIGSHSVVMPGVTIGKNAVVGMDRAAVGQTVVHKIQGPGNIGCSWRHQRLRLPTGQPFLGFDPQIEP